ncbi:MAG: TraV family lipoprotein [Rhodocyclaceae bacterium]|nr:TraV family lipoprotein [Rhodocyclaceae bacterium]
MHAATDRARLRSATTAIAAAVVATACGSITGLDNASSSTSCPMIGGTPCIPMAEAYRRSVDPDGAPPPASSEDKEAKEGKRASLVAYPRRTSDTAPPPAAGTPLHSPAVELRIWFAPWEDRDGALHDQQYVYVVVDPGRWLVDAYRAKTAEQFRPVRAPAEAHASQPAAAASPAPSPSPGRDAGAAAAEFIRNMNRPVPDMDNH